MFIQRKNEIEHKRYYAS